MIFSSRAVCASIKVMIFSSRAFCASMRVIVLSSRLDCAARQAMSASFYHMSSAAKMDCFLILSALDIQLNTETVSFPVPSRLQHELIAWPFPLIWCLSSVAIAGDTRCSIEILNQHP